MLYSYLRYTDKLLDVSFLLLAVILSQSHEKPRREDFMWGIYVKEITFLAAYLPSYVIFCRFIRLLPPPMEAGCLYLLDGVYKDT